MAKKRRVPEVLWRLFRKKARTLADTIMHLVSRSCGEAKNAFFLIKRGDPSDYRGLLNQCFVVVNEKAPPFSGFSLVTHWSQHEIVERIMEMSQIMETSNVIYCGFDKYNCSSPILELLCGPSWLLLLERVGENVMCYLLNHTSIFLPLPPKKHHQVTGPPITNHEFFKGKAVSQGHQKKRKTVDIATSVSETWQESSSVGHRAIGCVGCSNRSYVRQFRRHPGYNSCQMTVFGVDTVTSGAVAAKYEGDVVLEPYMTAKPKKGSRPFRWQRRKNCSYMNVQEFSDKIPCTIPCNDKDSLCGKHQYDNSRMQETCSCCLMLQAPQLVTDRDHINRRYMFYSLECSSTVLPRWHILNSLKPKFSDSKFLIKKIFGLSDVKESPQSIACCHSSGFCLTSSACLYHKLVRLLKILICRFQSCQHLRLLDKHCVPSADEKVLGNSSSLVEGNEFGKKACGKSNGSCTKDCKKTLEASDSHFEAIKPYCLKSQVESFIWAVCRSIIPADLLGTPSNWRVLRRNISKFIQLRRFEKFSIKQCVHKLKISKFPFLSDKHSSCYLKTQVPNSGVKMYEEFNKLNNPMVKLKHKLLVNWIFWFFSHLVVPLVQANFYVTESEHGKQDIYYYRKSVWENLMKKAITGLKDKSHCQLDDAAVRSVISHRSFGFSKLRLLPKENGVRMLANLKAPSRLVKREFKDTCSQRLKDAQMCRKRVKFDHFKSVNGVLRDIHAVLKGLVLKEPEKVGSSVFDYNDVYRKLCPFLIGLRNGSTTIPGIFVVVSDVSKAFDSIDQDRLLGVMNDVILEDKYLLVHPNQVVCTKKSMWIHDNPPVLIDHNASTCTRFASSLTFPSLHRILVNQGRRRYVRKEELLFNLNEHVKRNVLQLDKKFYLQSIGIPQGSVISSLLCSLYYGDLERNVIYPFIEETQESVFQVVSASHHFGENRRGDTIISSPSHIIDLEKPLGGSPSILLRFIDDLIFMSTSKKQATNFFYRLQKGFPSYNCYMNEEKFCVNFDIGHKSGLSSNRVYVGEDGISFLRWSGLLINCSTAEVQGDYTRYWNNHLSSTLTVCWQGKPGHHLKLRLCAFMRPKCHPIFFDSNINSAAVVRLNIYQAFLLCAMKFHCYVSDLSYICKLRSSFYLKIIERSLRYMHMLIKRRMQFVNVGSKFHPVLRLEDGEVEWLGLNAYVNVLKRKQSRHKELLPMLRSKLLAHRITESPSDELKYAVDASHSSLFWKIKY